MDEDFKDVTVSSHHTSIIFFLVIIILAVGGYFLVFKKTHFALKNMKIELGSTLSSEVRDYLADYSGSLTDYRLDVSKIDANAVGNYEYSVYKGKMSKKGKVQVVDTKAPVYTLGTLTIEEGSEEYSLNDFLLTCTDASKLCLVSLHNAKDENKLKIVGTHEVEIEVADVYGNKDVVKATVNVVAKGSYTDPKTTDLEYASSSLGEEAFDGIIFKKLELAINPRKDEARDEMSIISAIDLAEYVNSNYPGYEIASSNIVELYNKSGYIIGYAIRIIITNGQEKTIYVDSEKMPKDITPKDSKTE